MKKCTEKEDRLSSYPRNPHSNGLFFSRSFLPEKETALIAAPSNKSRLETSKNINRYIMIHGPPPPPLLFLPAGFLIIS